MDDQWQLTRYIPRLLLAAVIGLLNLADKKNVRLVCKLFYNLVDLQIHIMKWQIDDFMKDLPHMPRFTLGCSPVTDYVFDNVEFGPVISEVHIIRALQVRNNSLLKWC